MWQVRKSLILLLLIGMIGLNGCRSFLHNIPLLGNGRQNEQNTGTGEDSTAAEDAPKTAATDVKPPQGHNPENLSPDSQSTINEIEPKPEFSEEEFIAGIKKDIWVQNHQLSSWQKEVVKAKKRFDPPTAPEDILRYNKLDRAKMNDSVENSRKYAHDAGKGYLSWRWYHPNLETVSLESNRISALMRNTDPVTSGNAAILAGRSGLKTGRKKLLETIRNEKLSVQMRCAAIEAFSNLGDTTINDLAALMEPVKDGHIEVPGPDKNAKPEKVYKSGNPQMWSELLICASEKVSPHENPCFAEALESYNSAIRSKAVMIWAERPMQRIPTDIELPAGLYRCFDDPAHKTRGAALTAIARWKSPDALRYLRAGMNDLMAEVRVAAIEGLGDEGSGEALKILRDLSKDITQKEKIRCAVVRALHKAKQYDDILRMADEKSGIVRTAVAASLDGCRSPKGVEIAMGFVDDAPSVQLAMLASIEKWPLEESAPILFKALGRYSLICSNAAKTILAAQWSPAVNEYNSWDKKEEREKILQKLIGQYESENGEFRDSSQPGLFSRTESRPVSDTRTLGEIRKALLVLSANPRFDPGRSSQTYETEQLHRSLKEIDGLRQSLIPVLEHLIREEHIAIPEIVYMRSLPAVDSIFVSLANFAKARPESRAGSDYIDPASLIQQRRRITNEILAASRIEPLGFLASQRLVRIASLEDDPIILMNIIDSLGENSGESGRRFAGSMIGNSQYPDMERRCCVFLGRYGEPGDWEWLEPILDSGSSEIQRTSLKSLAKIATRAKESGNPDLMESFNSERAKLIEAVRPLLRHRDEIVQVDAALAMYHWGDPQARGAIERIGSERNETVRLYIARSVGELDDPAFVPLLISFLSGNGSVREAALKSLPNVLGVDHGGDVTDTQKRIYNWQQWYGETAGKTRPVK